MLGLPLDFPSTAAEQLLSRPATDRHGDSDRGDSDRAICGDYAAWIPCDPMPRGGS
jgi:hypothetical protein